jgi:hypothetical protein
LIWGLLIGIFCFGQVWGSRFINFLGKSVLHLPDSILGVVSFLLSLLVIPFIIFEVFGKFLLLQTLNPVEYKSADISGWLTANLPELNRYTAELEQLGFVSLGDHAFTESSVMMRVFVHPQEFCFVEVGQLNDLPIICNFICYLEQNWSLAITNRAAMPQADATWYAFLRRPNNLGKRMENASPQQLLTDLISWRQQLTTELCLQPIQETSINMHFQREAVKRSAQRKALISKSIIWCCFEKQWRSWYPQSEWLGDYPKLKARYQHQQTA